jgi:hypothetical protein
MQEQPAIIIDRMNRAYDAIYGTQSRTTIMKAEREFYSCQDWLRERGIKFHQTPQGKWILDGEAHERKNS